MGIMGIVDSHACASAVSDTEGRTVTTMNELCHTVSELLQQYAEIYIFSGDQTTYIVGPSHHHIPASFGSLYVKVKNRTRRIGCIKDIVSVRIKLNEKVSYKPPKIW